MPYPNEHAARMTDPKQYDSFARMDNSHAQFKNLPNGISVILGIKNGKSEIQAYRFAASQWTVAEAKSWLKEHDLKPIMFEEASGYPDDGRKAREFPVDTKVLHFRSLNELCARETVSEMPGCMTGRAVRLNWVDPYDTVFGDGCLDKSISEAVPAGRVKLMVRHMAHGGDSPDVIGVVTGAKQVDDFYEFSARYGSDDQSQEYRSKIREGLLDTSSIGFRVIRAEKLQERSADGTQVVLYREIAWEEQTMTVRPAHPDARVTGARGLSPDTRAQLAGLLERLTHGDASALDTARALLAGEDEEHAADDLAVQALKARAFGAALHIRAILATT